MSVTTRATAEGGISIFGLFSLMKVIEEEEGEGRKMYPKMSTNLTRVERQSVPKQVKAGPKTVDSKRQNLNRAPSLEKIKRFNTYICSQNYYILPALLSWLKTSQTVLQSYAEKCIYFVKSLIYHTLLYKTIETLRASFKGASPKHLVMLVVKVYGSVTLVSEELRLKLLATAVYMAFLLIFTQFFACAYMLSLVPVPGGLIFLLAGMSYISYINYTCLRFILIKKHLKEMNKDGRCDNSASEKYIRPKNILGKRTISNLNLF